jgi:hypothetical protein
MRVHVFSVYKTMIAQLHKLYRVQLKDDCKLWIQKVVQGSGALKEKKILFLQYFKPYKKSQHEVSLVKLKRKSFVHHNNIRTCYMFFSWQFILFESCVTSGTHVPMNTHTFVTNTFIWMELEVQAVLLKNSTTTTDTPTASACQYHIQTAGPAPT